jgi:hypothetical protein
MSLLLGFGQGLQQFSGILGQGMAEDRQVRRQEELERMRDASMEKRWLRETEMRQRERSEDRELRAGERAEDAKFRQSESNRQAGQFDRQMSVREQQAIESNLQGVMEQEARAAEKIRASFAKRMESGMGDPAALNAELDAELEANQMYHSGRLHNMIQSYGPKLRGTGYEYLLDFKQPEQPQQTNSAPEQAATATRDISQYVSKIVTPEGGSGLLNVNPNYKTDANGSPELSFSNLMRKWNTPSPGSPVLPTQKTPEQLEQERLNIERAKSRGITSAYGL